MMIEVANEFLDFDDDIEIERQIKLFEDISSTDGDYSYAFEIPKTTNNTRLLGYPFPDNISKLVYQRIPAKILSNTGAKTYDGYIRVERITEVYSCSFFAGNNNWFAQLTGLLSELDLSRYDIDQNEVTIIDSWSLDEGLVFPLLDNGGLITRSYPQLKVEDFVGGFYVKTIFKQIFSEAGIKLEGELLSDWRYQHLVCITNSRDTDAIESASSYVEKINDQPIAIDVLTKITWDNDSVDPFFDGADNAFDLPNSQYVSPHKMIAKIEYTVVGSTTGFFGLAIIFIHVNGTVRTQRPFPWKASLGENAMSFTTTLNLEIGDVVDIHIIQFNNDGDAGVIHRGTIKITPLYIYRVVSHSAVPNWTKQDFVSNILKIFNALASYDTSTATLTLNLFERIKDKSPIDLSEYISETEVDYSDFISDYAQRSTFGYTEVEFDELKTYNQGKYTRYGQGVLDINNDHLEDEDQILETDFANPIAYVNQIFDASLEKTNLIILEEGNEYAFSNVGNDGLGDAAFNVGDTNEFNVGDLVRIKDSTNVGYNGDWVVQSKDGVHLIFNGIGFDTAASGKILKLNYTYSTSDDVFLFLNIPSYPITNISNTSIVFDSGTFYPIELGNVALAYFDMINTGKQVNRDFIYSLSFGGIDDPLHYQVTMLESYFQLFSRVLNDPVKLICTAHIPYYEFVRIDFLRPITIKTLETSNSYYLNRISGYKESYLPCEIELIKIG